jgi:hypothetical protein
MAEVDRRALTRLLRWTLAASLLVLVLRLHIAQWSGFGDAEALYASYALFPQPAYLDHPGLIGQLARWIGGGSVPTPAAAHVFTSVMATLVPVVGLWAARAAGAGWTGALGTALTLTLVPELSIGLFALSPDLPLALLWLAVLGFAAIAVRAEPKSFRALWSTLAAGALVGVACLAKVSGALLGLALLITWMTPPLRRRWRTLAPWSALGVAAVLVAPVLLWEASQGYPMLQHRLVTTQAGAGVSLRNLGALLGGQLAYVTPPFLYAALLVLRDLWRRRGEDELSRLLWLCTVVPALPLIVLCLWSRVAEPHWLAPAYLPLCIHLARGRAVGRKLAIGSLVTGAVVTLLAWTWVSTPLPLRVLGRHYRARYDLANDLHAWGPGRDMLRDAVTRALADTRQLPVVVGPHWIVCAQAQAAVGHAVPVGCNSPLRDDFDRWFPRERWLNAPVVLYVQDTRFEVDPKRELPHRRVTSISRATVRRGGQIVRTLRATRLERASQHAAAPTGVNAEPAPDRAAPPP